MSTPTTPGARIRQLRREHGLTQDELARLCGVSRSAVAQWETDRAGQLRANISRISGALGASVEYLLHGAGLPEASTGDELALLRLYRECAPEDQAFLLRTARRLAHAAPSSGGEQAG
jgi:transcriptional regulator with XRE-family HTH domain